MENAKAPTLHACEHLQAKIGYVIRICIHGRHLYAVQHQLVAGPTLSAWPRERCPEKIHLMPVKMLAYHAEEGSCDVAGRPKTTRWWWMGLDDGVAVET